MWRSSKVLLEQVLSSLSSGLLLLSLVALTSPAVFGAVSLVYVMLQLALAILKHSIFLPLHTERGSNLQTFPTWNSGALVSALIGGVVGLASFSMSVVVFRNFALEAALVALCAPLLFLNEALRQHALARGEFQSTVLASSLWSVFAAAGFLLGVLRLCPSSGIVGIWLGGVLASLATLTVASRSRLNLIQPMRRTRTSYQRIQLGRIRTVRPARAYLAMGTLIPVSIAAFQLCVAYSAGDTMYGQLSANTLAWTPISVILASLPVLLSASKHSISTNAMRAIMTGLATAAVPVLTWSLILRILRTTLLPAFFGDSSSVVIDLLVPSAVMWFFFILQTFLLVVVLYRGDQRSGVVVGVAALVTRVALGCVLIFNPGLGIAWYVSIEALCHGVLAFVLLTRLNSRRV